MPHVKLDCGIIQSSLWFEKDCRDIFITALLMAKPHYLEKPEPQIEVASLKHTGWSVPSSQDNVTDENPTGEYGLVRAASSAIVRTCIMPMPRGMAAIKTLGLPDSDSRSEAYDGRRLVRIDGGYIVLNYMKYRERDVTAAERMKRYRSRHSVTRNGRNATRHVTHADADADADGTQRAAIALSGESARAGKDGKAGLLETVRCVLGETEWKTRRRRWELRAIQEPDRLRSVLEQLKSYDKKPDNIGALAETMWKGAL